MSYLTAWLPPGRVRVIWRARAGLLVAILAHTIPGGVARAAQEKAKSPSATVSAPSLARFAPGQDLILYLEYQGLDAHVGAWQKTAAYRLISETKFGPLVEDMAIQAIDAYQEIFPTEVRVKGVDAVEVFKRIARNGFVVAVFGKPREGWRYLVVLRQCDRPEIRAALKSLAAIQGREAEGNIEAGPIEKAGRTLHRFGSGQVWWVEKGDLILTGLSEADEILEVIDGRRPSAIGHPVRAELFKEERAVDPVAAAFIDAAVLGFLSGESVQLGLGGLKRLELKWGFDQDAFVGILRVVAPAPREGALALLDQPAFGVGSLPLIPGKVSGVTVMSVDHSANNAFPRAASIDENGKPLLSWRVAILPYLKQQGLYDKFNLDEPWDSAHNKALLKEMPPIYSCPNRVKPEPFTTTYNVLVGKNAMFEKDQDIGVGDVTDGTSNTFLVVESRNPVPWTKPDDLTFDPGAAASRCGAGSSHPGEFNVAMGHGSVRFIKDTIDVKKFRSMITRNLGEVVTADDF
jgi:Protein of unknown function (DUF1559)